MYLKCVYIRDNLDVDFYPNFFTPELSQAWYSYLDGILPHENKRSSMLLGDEGLIYRVMYQDVTRETFVYSWESLPALPELKSLVEKITGQKYTVCVIQRYPNGKVGINPHRDREMVFGTRIVGLSLGATRTISFTRKYHDTVPIQLVSGSLYVMNPPTNSYWLHSITKDPQIKESRFSLTFRDYKG